MPGELRRVGYQGRYPGGGDIWKADQKLEKRGKRHAECKNNVQKFTARRAQPIQGITNSWSLLKSTVLGVREKRSLGGSSPRVILRRLELTQMRRENHTTRPAFNPWSPVPWDWCLSTSPKHTRPAFKVLRVLSAQIPPTPRSSAPQRLWILWVLLFLPSRPPSFSPQPDSNCLLAPQLLRRLVLDS